MIRFPLDLVRWRSETGTRRDQIVIAAHLNLLMVDIDIYLYLLLHTCVNSEHAQFNTSPTMSSSSFPLDTLNLSAPQLAACNRGTSFPPRGTRLTLQRDSYMLPRSSYHQRLI